MINELDSCFVVLGIKQGLAYIRQTTLTVSSTPVLRFSFSFGLFETRSPLTSPD